ncbi:MAG: OmpA family protein [Bacteroidales bacterium]
MNRSVACILLCAFSLHMPATFASDAELDLARLNPRNWVKSTQDVPEKSFEEAKGAAIGGKPGEEIKTFMLKQGQKFKSVKGAIVSTIRNGEVLKISLPASVLFVPNDTILATDAELSLRPILTFMRRDLTDLLITGHSDNTGSKAYIGMMSRARASAVEAWFRQNGVTDGEMGTYSFGDQQPLFDNDSMETRAKNRRITFYLVPNQEMIKQAKRKRLNK